MSDNPTVEEMLEWVNTHAIDDELIAASSNIMDAMAHIENARLMNGEDIMQDTMLTSVLKAAWRHIVFLLAYGGEK